MKILIASLALLALTACGIAQTPEEQYFVLNGAVTSTGRLVESYVDECKKLPVIDPCYRNLPKIHDAATKLQTTLHQADRVFITKDSQYYSLSLSVVQNALANLQKLLKEPTDD